VIVFVTVTVTVEQGATGTAAFFHLRRRSAAYQEHRYLIRVILAYPYLLCAAFGQKAPGVTQSQTLPSC
jgi:hypothetical protein